MWKFPVQIRATAIVLHHSSRQCWILNPLIKARDGTCILMDISRVHYHWAMTRTLVVTFLIWVLKVLYLFWIQVVRYVLQRKAFLSFFAPLANGCSQASDWIWAAAWPAPQLWQHQILNPLHWAGNRTCTSSMTWATSVIFLTHFTTVETPVF